MTSGLFTCLLKGDYQSIVGPFLVFAHKQVSYPAEALGLFLPHLLDLAFSEKHLNFLSGVLLSFKECNTIRLYQRLPEKAITNELKHRLGALDTGEQVRTQNKLLQ